MNRDTCHERIAFVERIVLDRCAPGFGEALQTMLLRLERETPRLAGPVRVTTVRRMAATEVARLRLEPASGAWFEVCGDLLRSAIDIPRRSDRIEVSHEP